MPYIRQDRREMLDAKIEALQDQLLLMGDVSGDLNYVISRLVGHQFRTERSYDTIALVTGVLENVKQEFYSRAAGPYERAAAIKNGDIPEYDMERKKHGS